MKSMSDNTYQKKDNIVRNKHKNTHLKSIDLKLTFFKGEDENHES